MGLTWNWFGFAGTATLPIAWAMAWIVYHARPKEFRNRVLAVLLFAEGLWVGTAGGLLYMVDDRQSAFALQVIGWGGLNATVPLYLLLLTSLDTPWMRRLRSKWVRGGLWAAAVAGFFWPVVQPGFWIIGMVPVSYAAWDAALPPRRFLWAPYAAVYTIGVAVALSSFLRAKRGTAQRTQSGLFAIAFGTRDIVGILVFAAIAQWIDTASWAPYAFVQGHAVAALLLIGLLSYAVLRAQLFDINVRIRWTAVRTAMTATLVGAFILSSQLAGRVLEPRTGAWIGVVVVAGVAVMVPATVRWADRLVARILPSTSDDDSVLDKRKMDVYRLALLEAVAADGAVKRSDRIQLAILRGRLALSERDHQALLYAILTSRPAQQPPLHAGLKVLRRYRLIEPLDAYGRGLTWLATNGRNEVVVKRLGPAGRDRSALEVVQHPNLVSMIDSGDDASGRFVVLERMPESLADRLEREALTNHEWQRLATGLLHGLEALHAAGVVHKDIKPANVLLSADGDGKLTDFDVARVPGLDVTLAGDPDELPVGTLRYMSPEQAQGRYVTERSDLYSLAATLFEALVGEPWIPVIPGETAHELRLRAARGRGAPRLPPDRRLGAWFQRALARTPDERFTTAREMHDALLQSMSPPTGEAIPAGEIAAAG